MSVLLECHLEKRFVALDTPGAMLCKTCEELFQLDINSDATPALVLLPHLAAISVGPLSFITE
jgi:hypothetical protein